MKHTIDKCGEWIKHYELAFSPQKHNTLIPIMDCVYLIVNKSVACNLCFQTGQLEKAAALGRWWFFPSIPSFVKAPQIGNGGLDRRSGCQDNGYRRVTENPWQCKHTDAIQTTTAFGPEPPLTGVICCINLQLGPVWLLSGFHALGQKRRTPCPLTKGLALIGVDKGCWWSLLEQLNLVNES